MGERIAVIGTGYVGLVSGTCFSEIGHHVVCVDKDADKIQSLSRAELPIYEPDLQQLVQTNLQRGRLSFTSDTALAVSGSDIVFLAVGTPSMEDGQVDVSQVTSAAIQIAMAMEGYTIVVLKSTVPVGTARRVENLIREYNPEALFSVVSNPEFLREGSAVRDTFHMDRIVIGATEQEAADRIARLHEPYGAPVLFTDRESAELIKYASNAFLATKISFINEMANLCEKVGANVELVAAGMGMDKRIGTHFLRPGIGYGGSCFPKDTKAQLKIAEHADYDFKIMRAVIEVNRLQRERFADKVEQALGGDVNGLKLAVMGLTFKPDTDDLRDAPALDIIELLLAKGAQIRAYDPVAAQAAAPLIPRAVCCTDPYEALQDADAMVITTEWDTVKSLDYAEVHQLLRSPVIIDGRNCLQADTIRCLGFHYVSVGRP
ncbi:UDP-glucose/GDP-mannose dehydrogenase family protein [Paenibacillus sp. H1-7]|uniref:UDP-glucose dehydrogenase family protein n=1 Tax=Paenibacillus sp. H1-7 TaxID=2282849 RepID=UPI001EF78687|nr:UDP-glucose/GDP-mannose dehydrogenase family protein [Paenibacillus sp. H1-7]ULL17421.1 UDP-glucose/GDP-mannose dehydrogenase family protein [Paenibacillus sp. H1-7]